MAERGIRLPVNPHVVHSYPVDDDSLNASLRIKSKVPDTQFDALVLEICLLDRLCVICWRVCGRGGVMFRVPTRFIRRGSHLRKGGSETESGPGLELL